MSETLLYTLIGIGLFGMLEVITIIYCLYRRKKATTEIECLKYKYILIDRTVGILLACILLIGIVYWSYIAFILAIVVAVADYPIQTRLSKVRQSLDELKESVGNRPSEEDME